MTIEKVSAKFTMRPDMYAHDRVTTGNDPVVRYLVFNEHGMEVAYITNACATGRPASWGISQIIGGRVSIPNGDYATAEEALGWLNS